VCSNSPDYEAKEMEMSSHRFYFAIVFTAVLAITISAGNQRFGLQDQPSTNAASTQATPTPTPTPQPTPAECDLTRGFGGFRTQTGGGFFSSCNGARLEAAELALDDCETTTTCSGTCKNPRKTCKSVLDQTRFTKLPILIGCQEMLTYRCACDCRK
jgi:hypothetical protein